MHLLGCLGFFLFFFLILGISVLGSIVSGIWNLLFGRSPGRDTRSPYDQDEPRAPHTTNQSQGYTFRPDDGEYIDYEEVES